MNAISDASPSVSRRGTIVCGPTRNYEPLEGGLGKLVFEACDKYGDQILRICGATGQTETFSSFKSRSVKVAKEIRRRGVSRKDVIVICTPNTYDSDLVPAAALYLGVTIIPLDPGLSLRENTYLLSDVDPKIIFVHEKSLEVIRRALENNNKTNVEIVVYGSSDEYSTFNEFLVDSNEDFEPEYLNNDEIAFVLFSSGTTGLPKGVVLTHKSLYLGSKVACDTTQYGTCGLQFATFFWITAVLIFISQFFGGSKRVFSNNFNPENAFELIGRHQVSMMFLASSNIAQICKMENLDKYDTSSLEFIIFSGDGVKKEHLLKVRQMLPQTYSVTGYGMTEVPGIVSSFLPHEKELAAISINSCGRPLFNIELKIVDLETENSLGVNEPGEIRIRTDSLMPGYYKHDSANIYDSDGYIKTGDIGYLDENSCLYVTQRIKTIFKYCNKPIDPNYIENIIEEVPGVMQVIVFGIPDENDGFLPAAAVTLSNENVSEEDISDFVAQRVSDWNFLRGGVYILDEMPMTPSEKINRDKILKTILEKIQNKK